MQKRRELMAQTNEPLLSVKGLKQYFPVSKKFTVRAVDNISFDITLATVGNLDDLPMIMGVLE